MRFRDHFDLQRVRHAGLFEIGAEDPVDQAYGGEVLNAGKAQRFQLIEEDVDVAERIGSVDAGEHRCPGHDRQHFAGHLQNDRIGVAIGHQTGKRAATGHAVTAGIVDHDQVDPAGLLAFRRQPGAGAAADDRFAPGRHLAKPLQQYRAFKPGHRSPHHSSPPAGAP